MTDGEAEDSDQRTKPYLAQVLLTPDARPLGVTTETETCTIRVEPEYVDPETAAIPPYDIDETVRERVTSACEFTSDAADEYWDIQLLLRTDLPPRERFRLQLERVQQTTPRDLSDGYSMKAPIVFTPEAGRGDLSLAGLVVHEDMPPKTFGHFLSEIIDEYGLRGKDIYDTMLDAAISVDPTLPDQFLRNPRRAQERFYSILVEDKGAIRDIAVDNRTTAIKPDNSES